MGKKSPNRGNEIKIPGNKFKAFSGPEFILFNGLGDES
jgi:hypothetical protein